MRRGFTLIELTVVLLLMATTLSALLPAARRQRDRMAVVSAREAWISRLARTRREARLAGGATLHVERDRALVWIEVDGEAMDTLDLGDRFGVSVGPSSGEVLLSFDALGIGRLANRSLVFARGDAQAGVAVSAYGRVRRW
jgi:prepilin-type N-terminal cleavage/methylation domain-containing protein